MPLLYPDRQLRGRTQDRQGAPEQRGQPVWLGTSPGASGGCCQSEKRSHIPAATATCTGPGAPAQLLATGGLGSLCPPSPCDRYYLYINLSPGNLPNCFLSRLVLLASATSFDSELCVSVIHCARKVFPFICPKPAVQ